MPPRLAVIEVVVSDMDAALEFYRRLGLDIPPPENPSHVEVAVGGLTLAFDTVEVIRSFDPDWNPPIGGHRVALAFDCGTPTDVDATYAALTGAGHHGHKPPWDAFWGMRYAVVHDPDGNTVDLFANAG